jgi:hypothetical protein
MRLAQDDEMVYTLAPDRSDQPLLIFPINDHKFEPRRREQISVHWLSATAHHEVMMPPPTSWSNRIAALAPFQMVVDLRDKSPGTNTRIAPLNMP